MATSVASRKPLLLFSMDKAVPSVSEDELRQVLCENGLENSKVAVISISGRFRQGKSFLLNLFARYLRANRSDNWIIDGKSSQEFEWGHSRKPLTKGVLMYPEVLKARCSNGEEIAVLLVDSQGIFDKTSSMAVNKNVFIFTLLLSSKQIFNTCGDINADDLMNLSMFCEYGKVHVNSANSRYNRPFQNLILLIRDWKYPGDFPFGLKGGQQLIDEAFQTSDELLQEKNNIEKCFQSIGCFLMPTPGEIVCSSPKFDGDPSDINIDFLSEVTVFFDWLISTLEPKQIQGKCATLSDYCSFVKLIENAVRSDEVQKPETSFKTPMTPSINQIRQLYEEEYMKALNQLTERGPFEEKEFQMFHDSVVSKVLDRFSNHIKVGPIEEWETVENDLRKFFQKNFCAFATRNLIAFERTKNQDCMEAVEVQSRNCPLSDGSSDRIRELEFELGIERLKTAKLRIELELREKEKEMKNFRGQAKIPDCTIQ